VVSEFTSKLPEAKVISFLNELSDMDVALSVITIGEIKNGIHSVTERRKRDKLETWFKKDLLPRFKNSIVAVDVETMIVWGEMTAALKRDGVKLPVMDSLIAAQCLQHDLCIVTRNVKDFKLTGISIKNPWGV
jgi:predicted nucleic acid-binding protein